MSKGDTRDLATQLVSSGQIGAENLQGILSIAKNYGATTGIADEELGADLAKKFAEPGKAAADLYKQYGMISAAAAEDIQHLDAQNQRYAAQALLLKELTKSLRDADAAKTPIGGATSSVGRGLSNAWDWTGSTVAGILGSTPEMSSEDMIALKQRRLAEVRAMQGGGVGFYGATVDSRQVEIDRLTNEISTLEKEAAQKRAATTAEQGTAYGVAALETARRAPANASAMREQALRDEIASMQAGLGASDLSAKQRGEISNAIKGQTAALDAMATKQERANTLTRLDMQIATERNPLRRADLAGLQAFIKASEQGIPVAERLAEGDRARAQALNEVLAGAANQSASMAEEAIARDRLNTLVAQGAVSASDASTWMERELTLRPLLAAAARAEGKDKSDLEAEIRKLEKGYEDLARARRQETVIADGKASYGITGLPAFAGGAGHAAAAGMGAGGAGGALPGAGGVQAQMWGFFQGKGLQPHQIAAILGHASVESSFDPYAVGDGGTSFGLFQHHAGRGRGLLGSVGGEAGLGNIQAQLEYVWKELLTSENGAFQKLTASTNVYDATHAFSGFERMSGYNANNPQSAMHWDRRLAGAEAALAKFEGTSVSAQAQLGTLGTGAQTLGSGMQQMTANLAGTLQGIGASYGPGGAFIGGLLGEGLKLLTGGGAAAKPAGYMIGGYTGPGATTDVAGVVHAEEYVFDAASTRRIGVSNLEAMRRGALKGYREGGYVVGGRSPVPSRMAGSASNAAAAATAPKPVEMHLKVSGTGNTEVREATAMAIRQALEAYDREAMPGRVRMIVDHRWED